MRVLVSGGPLLQRLGLVERVCLHGGERATSGGVSADLVAPLGLGEDDFDLGVHDVVADPVGGAVEHDPADECIGAEHEVEISREPKLRLTDNSWRRPYMQADIAMDGGAATIHLGYDEELGHYLTPDEAQQYAVEVLLLVAQAKGQL